MKVQDRNVDLLHGNIKILQNELAQKNEIIKSLMEIQSTEFDSLSAERNDQTISDQQQQQQQSQQLLEHNRQCMNSSKCNKINILKIYNYHNNNSSKKVITV